MVASCAEMSWICADSSQPQPSRCIANSRRHHFEVHYLRATAPISIPSNDSGYVSKADFFSDFIAKSTNELTQRLCHALTSFMNDPAKSRLSVLFPEMICERCSSLAFKGSTLFQEASRPNPTR
jgi:hypothetical protein